MAQNCSLLSCPRPVVCFAHRLHQLSAAYHRLLHVDLLSSGQTEVCDLRHQVVSHQNVPGGQISVDELQRRGRKWKRTEMAKESIHESWINATLIQCLIFMINVVAMQATLLIRCVF